MEKQTESRKILSILSLVGLMVLGSVFSASRAVYGQGTGPESLDPYLKLLNELSERRRMNVYFVNEQMLSYGVQVGYVNLGRGNLTFQRRDLVAVGRVPLVLARAYDSALRGGGDFGPGWHLTAAETIRANGRGFVHVDESASELRFLPGVDGYELSPPGPNDFVSLTPIGEDRLRLELRSGMVKMFHRVGKRFCLTRVEDRNGNVVELEYVNGLLAELRQQAGRFIRLQRDKAGRIVSISDDQGRRVSYGYGSEGRLEEVRDMGDYVWRYAYDGRDRLVRVWDPMGSETFTVAYGLSGRVAEIAMPGDVYSFHYRGSETEVVDAKGHSNTFRQNAAGITVEVDNALGVTSRVDLDSRHRVRRLSNDGRTEVLLGYRGDQLAWLARKGGRRTLFTYDSAGRLVEMSTAGKGPIMTLVYDDRGNLISRRDATGESSYRYSSRGDLIEAALPAGEGYRFAINDEGQIAGVTTGNDHTTRFEYQPDGKLALSAFSDGSSHHYAYDALGLRSETLFDYGDGNSARVEYDHNPTGSLTRTTIMNALGAISGNQLILDDDQKIVAIEYFGRRRFALDYDGRNNLVRARADDDKGQEAILFKYDALDRLVGVYTAMDQDLSYEYAPGEADLRLQYDAKTRPADSPRRAAGTTFASALEVLFNRTRRSAYGAAAFEASSMSFVLTGEHGIIAPDELMHQSWRRTRFTELESEDYKQHFEQPSSILFWPAEYQALNCCITCEIIYGVSCECLDPIPSRFRCQDCLPLGPTSPVCKIDGPSSVRVGENVASIQTTISPLGTATNWRTVTGTAACLPFGTNAIGARATVTNKIQMTCNYIGGVSQESNQFSVSGQASTQFVRLVWTTAANTILAGAFSAADASTIRNRVEETLVNEFQGANIVFADSPSGGVTKITTLSFLGNSPGSEGGEASYDRLNFVRNNTGVVYIGTGSLNIASSSDPVSSTPINERRIRDRVGDAIARLAAHEVGHMLGLVPIASELTGTLWGDLAICHGVHNLGLGGTSMHHNTSSSSARIMTSPVSLTWSQTWNRALYSFSSQNDDYVERVLQ